MLTDTTLKMAGHNRKEVTMFVTRDEQRKFRERIREIEERDSATDKDVEDVEEIIEELTTVLSSCGTGTYGSPRYASYWAVVHLRNIADDLRLSLLGIEMKL